MKNSAHKDSIPFLEQQAVKAAIKGTWDQAIDLNQKILKLRPENVAALNRLGRAFWEKGNLSKAKKIYQQVLKIDPYNLIATKNLKRLADRRKTSALKKTLKKPTEGVIFVEEPGKTKLVRLVRLASAQTLSELNNADQVLLSPKKHTISVISTDGTYLGTIPDDLSFRLLRLIKGGNHYLAFVKLVDRQTLEIFIKETKRALKFQNFPSFTPSSLILKKG